MAIDGGTGGTGEFQTVSIPSAAPSAAPAAAPGASYQSAPVAPAVSHKGGFWIRFVAWIIDAILLGIIGGILTKIFGTSAGGGLNLLVGIIYYVYFWSSTGQTIGMKVTNLRVIKEDGSAVSVTDGIVRYVGLIISFVVIFLGVLWVAWDGKKQGWHDKMAHTLVVKA